LWGHGGPRTEETWERRLCRLDAPLPTPAQCEAELWTWKELSGILATAVTIILRCARRTGAASVHYGHPDGPQYLATPKWMRLQVGTARPEAQGEGTGADMAPFDPAGFLSHLPALGLEGIRAFRSLLLG
jgi:hypothetical protein